jgi:hypothetical protein
LRHFEGGLAESGVPSAMEFASACDVCGPQEDESRREGRRGKARGKHMKWDSKVRIGLEWR